MSTVRRVPKGSAAASDNCEACGAVIIEPMPYCPRCGACIANPPLQEKPARWSSIILKGCTGGAVAMLLLGALVASIPVGFMFVVVARSALVGDIVPQGVNAEVVVILAATVAVSIVALLVVNRMQRG